MKPSKVICGLLVAVIAYVAFRGWTTYDHDFRCMKCLAEKHVVEQRLFGITASRRTIEPRPAADYERIFGHPCDHIFRKISLTCGNAYGLHKEGSLIRPRLVAVAATYDAEQRLHDPELTLDTFHLIDKLMPPDIDLQQRQAITATTRSTLFDLSSFLRRANTIEQWRAILDAARRDFSDTSGLPNE